MHAVSKGKPLHLRTKLVAYPDVITNAIVSTAPMSPMAMMMASLARNPNNFRYATCTFNDTWTSVLGRVDFRQFVSVTKFLWVRFE